MKTLHCISTECRKKKTLETGDLQEKTRPNCRLMTWLWHHHWCNHYSFDVLRVTRSCTTLSLYYYLIKYNLFIKIQILRRGKNTKIWNFYKFKNFRKFSGASNTIATIGLPRAAETWKFLRVFQMDGNWKWQKHSLHQFILPEFFQSVWVSG